MGTAPGGSRIPLKGAHYVPPHRPKRDPADRRIIGIFDLDKCSYGRRTREYLAAAEKEGVVLDVSGEIPKSFVVCDHPYHRQIVYLSQLNSSTLKNRAESGKLEL